MGVGYIHGVGDVYYVPGATLNLLSISSLTKSGQSVTFTKDKVFLNDKLIGRLNEKLYFKYVESDFCSPLVAEDESFYDDKLRAI